MKSACSSLVVSNSINEALHAAQAVVAMESTVLTHGLPYPQNWELFLDLEQKLRARNVVPATIIVIDGIAHIGVEDNIAAKLHNMLKESLNLKKLGMRDLALAAAQGWSGGTTVSATMLLANLAGIEVFATGGIGGVHRAWEETMDISSDLTALSSIPVAVVSAGCKAILDIAATLEYLETQAIPVLGWKTDEFPQFYSRESGHKIDACNSADEFSAFWRRHLELGGKGVLVANPIPAQFGIPLAEVETWIERALTAAKIKKVSGKELTPFLLDYLAKSTEGESVKANLALLRENVDVAAELAIALAATEE